MFFFSYFPAGQATDTGKNVEGASKPNWDYIAFVLVPAFFLLGLIGVVICHVLKKKGYRCTTAQDGEEEEEEECKEDLESELGGGKLVLIKYKISTLFHIWSFIHQDRLKWSDFKHLKLNSSVKKTTQMSLFIKQKQTQSEQKYIFLQRMQLFVTAVFSSGFLKEHIPSLSWFKKNFVLFCHIQMNVQQKKRSNIFFGIDYVDFI